MLRSENEIKVIQIEKRILFITSCISVLLGGGVLFGWYTANITIIQVSPQFAPMQYNTALGFLLCGLGGILHNFRYSRLSSTCGVFVATMAILTLLEYALGINIGIDELFMDSYIIIQTSHAGRMAPNTALNFAFAGFVLSLSIYSHFAWQTKIWSILGTIVVSLGVVAIIYGYLVGVETIYGWGSFTRMAVHTSLGFVILGIGIVSSVWQKKYISLVAGISTAVLTLCFWQALTIKQELQARESAKSFSSFVQSKVETQESFLPLAVLITGFGIAILLYLTVHFAYVASERAKKLEEHIQERTRELAQSTEGLKKSTQKLKLSNSELDDFVYIASHDLKSPLRSMNQISLSLLKNYDNKLDDKGSEKLQRLQELTHRMEELINSLLYYSRLRRTSLVLSKVNIRQLILEAINFLRKDIEENKVEIIIPELLPEISCDFLQTKRVFINLIANAIQYSNKADKRIEVGYTKNVKTKNKKKVAAFYVKDNGIGIKAKHQESMFRIFKRLHHQDKFGEGMGTGLTIVKKIIEHHNGKIWVESTYGEGSTFFFTL